MTPAVAVNIDVPPLVWWITLAIVAIVDIVWNIYRVQAVLDQLDRATDDADKGARGVERHDGEIEEIRTHLATADTGPLDTVEAPAVEVAGGLRTGRPTPYQRNVKGRHSA